MKPAHFFWTLAALAAAVSIASHAEAVQLPSSGGNSTGNKTSGEQGDGKDRTETGADVQLAPPEGNLPWKNAGDDAERVEPPGSARELLKSFDIGDADLATFQDGAPASAQEQETIYRILYRLPQFRRENVAAWAADSVPWQQLLAQPAEHRARFFRLEGRATQVVEVKLPVEKAEIYEMPSVWRVSVAIADAPPVTVLSRDVPQAWLRAGKLDQPMQAYGLFLKVEPAASRPAGNIDHGEAENDKAEKSKAENDEPAESAAPPPLLFAAERIAWYPSRVDPQLGVQADQVYLAKLGLDVGEFDEVADRSKTLPREAFYQLLAAVGRADRQELQKLSRPFSIADLLQKSSAERGRVISITGHAQQVTKILVDEPDIRRRYGIDHYYELDMFVPLDSPVLLEDPRDKTKSLAYNTYPITVCVRELPEGLIEPDKPNVYQVVNRDVTLPAVFLKVWAVSTARSRELGGDRKQFNPLLIGAVPQVVRYEPLASPVLGIAVGVAFAVVLAALWLGIWRSQKKDKRFERDTVRRQFEVEPGKSLDELGIESRDGPDFSGLEKGGEEGRRMKDEG